MRQDDATDTVTPLKRMLECAGRQPFRKIDMNKVFNDLYEMQKKRKET